jgi:hypothetical protein
VLGIKHRNFLEDHFEPKVIDRDPLEDRPYYPMPVELTRYCFPRGLHLSKGNQELPRHGDFAFTTQTGDRVFISTLIFGEKLSPEMVYYLKNLNVSGADKLYI